MQYLSVTESADILGVSRSRVLQMIRHEQLDADRVGREWLIQRGSLPIRRQRPGRPMSERVAWGLILLSQGDRASWLGRDEVYRLRKRWRALILAADPVVVLRSWLTGRAAGRYLSATDPVSVCADPRLVASGWSDPRSRMSSAQSAEGYVHADDADGFIRDHLLVPTARDQANVIVHVTPVQPSDPVPLLLLVADLADHSGAREINRATELLTEFIAGALPGGELPPVAAGTS